jgi:hypothetical protein
MEETNGSPAPTEPNADDRIADLEAKLADVNRRYAASSEEGKRLAQTVQQLQASYVQPRQNVPNRAPYEEELETVGMPLNALDQMIGNRVQQGIAQAFEPFQRGIQARQTMVGRYKDYNKFESETMEYVNSDPELQASYARTFQADPGVAAEWAYLKFGNDKRKAHGNRGGGSNSPQEDQIEAQIPSQRSGDARRIPQDGGAVQEARRAWEQNKNPTTAALYAKARLKSAIPDEFLNQ